jgi:hypothetical protein
LETEAHHNAEYLVKDWQGAGDGNFVIEVDGVSRR